MFGIVHYQGDIDGDSCGGDVGDDIYGRWYTIIEYALYKCRCASKSCPTTLSMLHNPRIFYISSKLIGYDALQKHSMLLYFVQCHLVKQRLIVIFKVFRILDHL